MCIPIAILASLPLAAPDSKEEAPPAVGEAMPAFTAKDTYGKPFTLRRLVGEDTPEPSSALVLLFLDPEASACVAELNQIQKLENEWRGHRVEFLHVGLGASKKALRAFAGRHTVARRILVDAEGTIARQLGVETAPHLLVVAGNGNLAYISTRYTVGRYDELRDLLAWLTGQPRKRAPTGSALFSFDQKYRFGRPPAEAGAAVRWQPLAMHVGRMANAFISMRGAETYDNYIKRLKRREYDLVNAGPLVAHQLRDTYQPLVFLERRGQASYRGIIFALRNRGVDDLAGLSGKTLALVSEHSASGGAYPVAALLAAGLKLEQDVFLLWKGGHGAVARAVQKGEADAGACVDDCRLELWPNLKQRDAETRIIVYTDEIPADMVLVRRSIGKDDKGRLRRAFMTLNEHKDLLGQISVRESEVTGVSPVDKQAIAAMAKRLEGIPDAMATAQRTALERRMKTTAPR